MRWNGGIKLSIEHISNSFASRIIAIIHFSVFTELPLATTAIMSGKVREVGIVGDSQDINGSILTSHSLIKRDLSLTRNLNLPTINRPFRRFWNSNRLFT